MQKVLSQAGYLKNDWTQKEGYRTYKTGHLIQKQKVQLRHRGIRFDQHVKPSC